MSPRKAAEPAAALPESERKALSAGIAFALGCAAALSAPTLYELARLIGFAAALAWLLPAALDGYAGTSIWIGRRITRTHPAARAARRNARLALLLTIACNGLYHLLVLAAGSVPRGLHIGLLVAVSSLPPFIVDRLLHLNAIANGSADPTQAVQPSTVHRGERPVVQPKTDRPAAAPSSTPLTVQPADRPAAAPSGQERPRPRAVQIAADGAPTGQPSMDVWVEIGRPVYDAVKDAHGKRPPETPFQEALAAAAARLVAAGDLPEAYANPALSTAKRVRKAIEVSDPALTPVHLVPAAAKEAS